MATAKEDFKQSFNVVSYLQTQTVQLLKNIHDNISYPYTVAILNLNGGLNTASIIRTSCIYGCQKLLIFGQKNFDTRGLVGAQHYLTIEHIKDSLKVDKTVDEKIFLEVMKKYDLIPVFIEQGGTDLNTINWKTLNKDIKKKLCFVFGNESKGISKNLLELTKYIPESCIVSIRQPSILRSLNVSICAGIVLQTYYQKFLSKRLDYLDIQ